MKKFTVLAVVCIGLVFGGCASNDKHYERVSKVYKAGKTVYEVQPIKSNTLEAIGSGAEAYDELRSEVRGQ